MAHTHPSIFHFCFPHPGLRSARLCQHGTWYGRGSPAAPCFLSSEGLPKHPTYFALLGRTATPSERGWQVVCPINPPLPSPLTCYDVQMRCVQLPTPSPRCPNCTSPPPQTARGKASRSCDIAVPYLPSISLPVYFLVLYRSHTPGLWGRPSRCAKLRQLASCCLRRFVCFALSERRPPGSVPRFVSKEREMASAKSLLRGRKLPSL